MTIKRQYSLPNCKLILEGVGDEDGSLVAARPPLSVLVNAECHFTGYEKPLTGGREFLDSLAIAASNYAQEYLSGVRHILNRNGKPELVQLQKIDDDTHRLIVHPEGSQSSTASRTPTQIDLQTAQLFDLVEALDQLNADTQTLPDLSLKLTPASKRQVVSQEPVTKQAIPATIGVSGLAVAAGLLFLIPLPEVRRPEPTPTGATQESPSASPAPASPPTPTGANPPEAETSAASPIASVESIIESPSPEAASVSTASPDASPTEGTASEEGAASETEGTASGTDVSSLLGSAPEITDPAQLEQLTQQLRSRLDESWQVRPNFEEELVYQVGVAENGDVLGFRYVNDAAVTNVDQTPLLRLRYNPTGTAGDEAIAQFRVVFTPAGVVEVSPWHGRPPGEDSSP